MFFSVLTVFVTDLKVRWTHKFEIIYRSEEGMFTQIKFQWWHPGWCLEDTRCQIQWWETVEVNTAPWLASFCSLPLVQTHWSLLAHGNGFLRHLEATVDGYCYGQENVWSRSQLWFSNDSSGGVFIVSKIAHNLWVLTLFFSKLFMWRSKDIRSWTCFIRLIYNFFVSEL